MPTVYFLTLPLLELNLLELEYMVIWDFPGESVVKNSPAMQEMWVQSLGQEDHLEEIMATHSTILAWRIPWTEEPGGLQSMGFQRVRHDLGTKQQQP